jgi:hypothetical protein
MLSFAFADNALFGYDSLDDLWEQQIPPGEDTLPLRWNDSARERPILRECLKETGVTEDCWKVGSFRTIFKALLVSEGYTCGASVHMIRRRQGKNIDGK